MKLLNKYTIINLYILPLFILVVLIFGYWDALFELYGRLNAEERYSHGFMIPFVVIFLVQQRVELIKAAGIKFSWSGIVFIIIASLIYFIGYLSALWTVVQYSFFLMIVGIILSLTGWRATRIIIIPLSLLLLSIPLPYFIDVVLSGKMQLLSSKLGVDFIRFCNIPVFLEGNVIDLGVYKLQVVEACSGLRYMYPLMSIGLICAYMYNERAWKKVILFLSTIPITILMNSFRIGVTGVLVNQYGTEMAEGFLHDFEGWIIFMACFVLLFIEMQLLTKEPLGKIFSLDGEVIESNDDKSHVLVIDSFYSYPLIVTAFLVCALVSFSSILSNNEEAIPDRKTFISFPQNVAFFEGGKRRYFKNNEQDILKVTDYILIDYKTADNKYVNLYVGYHESQRTGSAPHSPRACIPGGGWEISSLDRIKLLDDFQGGQLFDSNRLIIKKGIHKTLVYYWFQQRGEIFANEYVMKWDLFKDGLFQNRSDGAMVRLTTQVDSHEDIEQADKRLKLLAQSLMPVLSEYIPR